MIPILIVVPALAALLVVTFVLAYLVGQRVSDQLAEFASELQELRELTISRPEMQAMHQAYQAALKGLLHTYEERFTKLETAVLARTVPAQDTEDPAGAETSE